MSDPWIYRPRPIARPELRLICVPYAGGAAQVFLPWADALPPGVELCAMQLPGRANRHRETPFRDVHQLVPAAAAALQPWLDLPFMLVGHSMGALIVFELARYFRRYHHVALRGIVVSGCRAPQDGPAGRRLHDLPEAEFMRELVALGGTPAAVLQQPALMQMIAPCLRADMALVETYRYVPDAPLACPLLVLGGDRDPRAPLADLEGWRLQAPGCTIRHLSGDHFFLHAQQARYLQELGDLLTVCRGGVEQDACGCGGGHS